MATKIRQITRDPTDDDMRIMSSRMRFGEIDEAHALGFISPYHAVKASVGHSVEAYVVTDDVGEQLAIFGLCVRPEEPGFGKPWMASSYNLSAHPKTVLKVTRDIVEHWHKSMSLYNYVYAENKDAFNFIEAVGFEMDPIPHHLPGTDELFHLFWMGDKPCVSSLPPQD